jgi:hypothetical protein
MSATATSIPARQMRARAQRRSAAAAVTTATLPSDLHARLSSGSLLTSLR